MKNIESSPSADAKGFTLTELVVVVAMVGILTVLCLTAMASAKGPSKIAACADNIRQLVAASQIYANDNQGLLPRLSGGAAWVWDLPDPPAQALLKTGLQKKNFYCPGTQPRFTDWQNFQAPGNNLWDYGGTGPNSFHVIGYSLAYWGTSGTLYSTNQNRIIQPEIISYGGIPLITPNSQRVLVADAVISSAGTLPGYLHPENNYVSMNGGFSVPHLSPHLRGAIPAGGNAGFKDGHVEWRTFNSMVPRNLSPPYFWW